VHELFSRQHSPDCVLASWTRLSTELELNIFVFAHPNNGVPNPPMNCLAILPHSLFAGSRSFPGGCFKGLGAAGRRSVPLFIMFTVFYRAHRCVQPVLYLHGCAWLRAGARAHVSVLACMLVCVCVCVLACVCACVRLRLCSCMFVRPCDSSVSCCPPQDRGMCAVITS
jgi:hypothetical protein